MASYAAVYGDFNTALKNYIVQKNYGVVAIMFDGDIDLFFEYCKRHRDTDTIFKELCCMTVNESFELYNSLHKSNIASKL